MTVTIPSPLPLPTLDLLGISPDSLPTDPVDHQRIAKQWFDHFVNKLQSGSNKEIVDLFADVSPTWRDILALTWDFRTFAGKDNIAAFCTQYFQASKLEDLELKPTAQLQRLDVDLAWIHADFTFTTEHGICSGILRLVPTVADGDVIEWKAHGVFTNLEGLKMFPEKIGELREESPSYGLDWIKHREQELLNENPSVLVIGGGQAGLTIAARLKYLGVTTLVVEKHPRVGDVWRNRYANLALHDPVWYDHLAYLPFPPTWPVYAPAAKVADWLESYAKTLDLNVWTSAEASNITREETTGLWNVDVTRKGLGVRALKVKHIVVAVGLKGGMPNIPTFEGSADFCGQIMHSSQFKSAQDHKGKKVVVIGSGCSGFDISVDCARSNLDVTMYQRGPTMVVSPKSVRAVVAAYSENGPPVNIADRIDASVPTAIAYSFSVRVGRKFTEIDKEMRTKLANVGFRLSEGPEDSGFLSVAYQRTGGLYIDQGGCDLLAEGKIKLKQGDITRFTRSGVDFADGSYLPADVIVCATGYQDSSTGYRALLGEEITSKMKQVAFVDHEGELSGIARKSGIPNLWVMTGGFKMIRFHSLHLALQIKAIEEGILSSE